MKGDFTRVTFDPQNHFSRVLQQQGRVTLDADPNEQTDILLHYLRTLARDLLGPSAGPAGESAFELTVGGDGRIAIGAGRYYVDGILVENDAPQFYDAQPFRVPAEDDPVLNPDQRDGKTFWFYVDVWERHVTAIEQDSIREAALNGPDTATRTQVIWQVRALEVEPPSGDDTAAQRAELEVRIEALRKQIESTTNPAQVEALQQELKDAEAQLAALEAGEPDCHAPLAGLERSAPPLLAARVNPGARDDGPCVVSPQARYRGAENQLYRVEIHQGGPAAQATFKWSRDNGSVTTRWLGTEGDDLLVSSSRGFTPGCWVELSDETLDLQEQPGVLAQVVQVEADRIRVDAGGASLAWSEQLRHPKLRRWDQVEKGDVDLHAGAVPVTESSEAGEGWIDLEDGVQVRFAGGDEAAREYRSGDYWLIPARVATGQIEWPADGDEPALRAARGVTHHYAPLGYLSWDDGEVDIHGCRCQIRPLTSCGQRRSLPAPAPQPAPAPAPAPGRLTPAPAPAPARPTGGATRRTGTRRRPTG